MSKIVTLEEYKGTFLEKCYISKPFELKHIFDTLNNKLEKGLIDLDLYDKSMSQLDSVLEKAKTNKYIKRTGTPGNYKYEYADGDGKTHERAMTNTLNEKVGVKGGDFSENKVKDKAADEFLKEADAWASELSNPTSKSKGMTVSEIDEKQAYYYRKYERALKKEESSKSKHISDMSKEEKHSMAEKMGISGHKEMTEKELSKQLIERKIDNELKGGGSVKELNNRFNIIKKELREKGYSENFQIYSSVEKENNLKNILKTPKGKEFIKLLKDIPLGVKISQPNWANEYIRNEKGFLDKFSNKILSINNFALNRISDNSTTGSEMKFEEPIKKSFEDNINILKGETSNDLIEKSKALPIGTVRDFDGKNFVKVANGKWKPYVGGEKKKATLEKKKERELSNRNKRLESFLAEFPDNATKWSEATDELRDLSRNIREFYNESGSGDELQSLDFKKFKTPSQWNTESKAFIKETYAKLNTQGKKWFDEHLSKFSGKIDLPKNQLKKSFEDSINILKGEQLEGGLGDNLSVEDIAKKHKVSKEIIENQLEIGIEVEMEHTNDKLKAKEIVLDHLTEASDYYTKLSEMEKIKTDA